LTKGTSVVEEAKKRLKKGFSVLGDGREKKTSGKESFEREYPGRSP